MPDLNKPADGREDRIEKVTKPHELGEYYLNTRTGEIEEGKVSGALNRMGPYPTREAATEAYDRAADRNEAWDEEDKAWRGEE